MEKAIFYILNNDSDMQTALADPSWAGQYKIYNTAAEAGVAAPYVTFERITTEPHATKDGVSKMEVVQVDVDVWTDKGIDCITIGGYVRTALDRTRGTFAGEEIQSIRFIDEQNDFNDSTSIFHKTLTFSVRVKNP